MYMSYYYLSRGKSRRNQPQAMNSYLGEQGWVLNSHLGRSFIIVSESPTSSPKEFLCSFPPDYTTSGKAFPSSLCHPLIY